LVHAALATRRHASPSFDPAGDGAIAVGLETTKARVSPLLQAISERQCTRSDYDAQALASAELRQLEQTGSGDGARVRLMNARPA